MASPLRFHPEVAADLEAATQWYDEISIQLGNRFRRAINRSLDAIAQRPEWFGRIRGERRAARIKGFPYLVIYEIVSGSVEILAILHGATDPDQWNR